MSASSPRHPGRPCLIAGYPLGADAQGRDILYRLLYGERTSLLIAASATVISLALATVMGCSRRLGGPLLAVAFRTDRRIASVLVVEFC